jgi:hypothetical protein
MLAIKPIDAFLVGDRQIISCHLPNGDPDALRGRELSFVRPGRKPMRIRITGWSTASDLKGYVFDLQYTGERIEPADVETDCLITDAQPDELQTAGRLPGSN